MDPFTQAIQQGWLRRGEDLLLPRLSFPLEHELADVVHSANRPIRDQVVADMLAGRAAPRAVPPCLEDKDEITVAHVDRYGIPLRESIWCLSRPAAPQPNAAAHDGPRVHAELLDLERSWRGGHSCPHVRSSQSTVSFHSSTPQEIQA